MRKNSMQDGALIRTKSQLLEHRRKSSIAYNHKKFSYFPKGMHGIDLPAFTKGANIDEQMYWKNDDRYSENPKYSSLRH